MIENDSGLKMIAIECMKWFWRWKVVEEMINWWMDEPTNEEIKNCQDIHENYWMIWLNEWMNDEMYHFYDENNDVFHVFRAMKVVKM